MKRISLAVTSLVLIPWIACAEWTPLLASTDFDGLKADVLTAVGGLMGVILIVLGIGILIRVLSR